jgi:hypothetical protein
MTGTQLYNDTVKKMPSSERLLLARLILDDIASLSDEPVIRDQAHLEELLVAGLHSGPGTEATPEFWNVLEAELIGQRRFPKPYHGNPSYRPS